MRKAAVDPFQIQPKLARECWAATLGGCSRKLSKEHVISNSAIGDGVHFGALNGVQQRIGAGSLKISVLCSSHNSALSEVDDEGAKLINAVKAYRTTSRAKLLLSAGAPTEYRVEVDGRRFERWAMKTFLNATAASAGLAKGSLLPPIALHGGHIVDYVFGRSLESPGAGLYWLNPAVSPVDAADRNRKNLLVAPMSDDVELLLDDGKSKGWFRFPVYGYFNIGGIELGMRANITTMTYEDWHLVASDIPCGKALESARLRPTEIISRPLLAAGQAEPTHSALVIHFAW